MLNTFEGGFNLQQHEIHHYLNRFFTSTGCETLTNTNSIQTTLTIEMDKLLMNRPFYWHYLEKTGGTPTLSTLNLTIDNMDSENELIHFGSSRLRQIFDIATELGKFIRLYQCSPSPNIKYPMQPWLMLNGTISYICNLKQERMYSYGINLLTGEIRGNFFSEIDTIDLTVKIPDYCFTLSPLIKVQSGILRIQEKIKLDISKQEHDWATIANEKWDYDLSLLEKFFEDNEELPESYHIEKQALQNQYEPKIKISILNGGLIYLIHS